jgi:hypothetical protein
VKEQSGSGEATTTGTASKPLNFSYKIDAKTNSTHQSDLAGQLGKKESATQAGCGGIGCGGLVALVGFAAWAGGASTPPYDAGPVIIMIVIGLVVLFIGIGLARDDSSNYAARKSEADKQNRRIDNAWYCAKCDVRFDELGAF